MKKSNLTTLLVTTITSLFLITGYAFAQDPSPDDWVTSEGKTYVTGSHAAIGTTTATSTLTIQGDQNSDGNPDTGTVLKFRGKNNAGDPWEIYRDNGLTGDLVIANDDGPGTRRESMRFDLATGNVGIGTTNPEYNLEIQNSSDAAIFLEADAGSGNEDNNSFIKYSQDSGGVKGYTGFLGDPGKSPENTDYTGTLVNAFLISNDWNDPRSAVQIGTRNNVRMTVNGNGNVGIGTTSPDTKLHVIGKVKIGGSESTSYDSAHLPAHGGILLKSSGTQTRTTSIYQDDGSGSGAGGLMIKSTHHDTVIEAGTVSSADILLNPTTGGNVGIGTTTPNYKLDVLGTIRAEEVKVETGWSDFVFEKDYNLLTLNQVESFIKENKHLPDIPSAKQVGEEGLSVAEMMSKQMQKIEELTLYMIEQNKRLDMVIKENQELKAQINRLKDMN